MRKIVCLIMVAYALFLGGCTASPVPPQATPLIENTAPAVVVTSEAAIPADTQSAEKITMYAPASTSSIPVIMAVENMENVELTLYTNQAQANTLFMRGDISILVTGVSVGVDMLNNNAPVQLANSFVSGLSYLVTYGKQVNTLSELEGQEIYLPFQGSPLEETTAYFVSQEGLDLQDDYSVQYMAFDSSVELLKQGKAGAVVMPEPNVTLVETLPDVYISLSYFDEWQKYHPEAAGYPQVGALVLSDWAETHASQIDQFNQALSEAITVVEQDPASAVEAVKSHYKLSGELLLKSLGRTRYALQTGDEMRQVVTEYYAEIEKPLNEKFDKFFYVSEK